MRNSDKGVSRGCEQQRVSRCAGQGEGTTSTYEGPVDSAYSAKGAGSSNSKSELI